MIVGLTKAEMLNLDIWHKYVMRKNIPVEGIGNMNQIYTITRTDMMSLRMNVTITVEK